MSNLDFRKKRAIESLLGMGSGYVLTLSKDEVKECIADVSDVDLNTTAYYELSSAKIVRKFCNEQDDYVVAELLQIFLDVYKEDSKEDDNCKKVQSIINGLKNKIKLEKISYVALEKEENNLNDTGVILSKDNLYSQSKNVSKIFISHSSADAPFGSAIVKLLRNLGLKKVQIVFTSEVKYGIPLGMNIFDYLKKQITDGVYILYLLSDNYYESVACLNEMGAAWVVQNQYTIVAVPGFQFSNPKFSKGAIDPKQIGFILDDQFRILEFRDNILSQFGLKVDEMDWIDYLKEYNTTIRNLHRNELI